MIMTDQLGVNNVHMYVYKSFVGVNIDTFIIVTLHIKYTYNDIYYIYMWW